MKKKYLGILIAGAITCAGMVGCSCSQPLESDTETATEESEVTETESVADEQTETETTDTETESVSEGTDTTEGSESYLSTRFLGLWVYNGSAESMLDENGDLNKDASGLSQGVESQMITMTFGQELMSDLVNNDADLYELYQATISVKNYYVTRQYTGTYDTYACYSTDADGIMEETASRIQGDALESLIGQECSYNNNPDVDKMYYGCFTIDDNGIMQITNQSTYEKMKNGEVNIYENGGLKIGQFVSEFNALNDLCETNEEAKQAIKADIFNALRDILQNNPNASGVIITEVEDTTDSDTTTDTSKTTTSNSNTTSNNNTTSNSSTTSSNTTSSNNSGKPSWAVAYVESEGGWLSQAQYDYYLSLQGETRTNGSASEASNTKVNDNPSLSGDDLDNFDIH